MQNKRQILQNKRQFVKNKRERKPPPEKIYKLKQMLLPLCDCCTKHVAKLALALATTNGIAKFFPKSRRNAVKNTLQGKTKGANSKNKISGRVNKNNAFARCKTKLLLQ